MTTIIFLHSGGSIADAIDDLPEEGGVIKLGAGTFRIDTRVDITKSVSLIGQGAHATTVTGGIDGDLMLRKSGEEDYEILFRDIHFVVENGTGRGCFAAEFVRNLSVIRCKFTNPNGFWSVYVGKFGEVFPELINYNIRIIGCEFNGVADSTYEQLLVFCCKGVMVKDCTFHDIPGIAIGLGLYQYIDGLTVKNCSFSGTADGEGHGIYYADTTNNFTIIGTDFDIGKPIEGCNGPTGPEIGGPGLPGTIRANSILIENCDIRASGESACIQLGAVNSAEVKGCYLHNSLAYGILVGRGNGTIDLKSHNVKITHNTIEDMNGVDEPLDYYAAGVLIQPGNSEDISDYEITRNNFICSPSGHQAIGITVDATGIHGTANEPVIHNNTFNHTEVVFAD